MEDVLRKEKEEELARLRSAAEQLEEELAQAAAASGAGRFSGYYATYYATTGFFLGMLAASTSLLFNVVGSLIFEKEPLHLIKVYLTFPLGERALGPDFDNGLILAIGCCLYIATGMLLGIPFNLIMTRTIGAGNVGSRFGLATVLGLTIWIVNYYLLLSWLQPLLFGGNWIVASVPWWVGGLTHLVYGWTMALVYPLGLYVPYHLEMERE